MEYEVEEIEIENEFAVEPEEVEEDVYGDDELATMYDEMLDECYPDAECCGISVTPHIFIEEQDPTAYRCGYNDFVDSTQETITKYICPICGEAHDDDYDAKYCCQETTLVRYEVNGEEFETEEEAQAEADRLNEEADEEE